MSHIKDAFENLPHVTVLYVAPDGDYYLKPGKDRQAVYRETADTEATPVIIPEQKTNTKAGRKSDKNNTTEKE